jgi:predicted oxidoreductase
MNWTIARKELAVSGAEFNDSIRDKKVIPFLKNLLLGNETLVQRLADSCPDFVVADTLDELVEKMNAQTGESHVDRDLLRETILRYDTMIRRGPKFHNDDQLRRIAHLRQYRGERVRTSNFQPILDSKPPPAIRDHPSARVWEA